MGLDAISLITDGLTTSSQGQPCHDKASSVTALPEQAEHSKLLLKRCCIHLSPLQAQLHMCRVAMSLMACWQHSLNLSLRRGCQQLQVAVKPGASSSAASQLPSLT